MRSSSIALDEPDDAMRSSSIALDITSSPPTACIHVDHSQILAVVLHGPFTVVWRMTVARHGWPSLSFSTATTTINVRIIVLPSHSYGSTLYKSYICNTVAQLNICWPSEWTAPSQPYDCQKRWDLVSLQNINDKTISELLDNQVPVQLIICRCQLTSTWFDDHSRTSTCQPSERGLFNDVSISNCFARSILHSAPYASMPSTSRSRSAYGCPSMSCLAMDMYHCL